MWGYDFAHPPKFSFNGGRGQVEVHVIGSIDVHMKKFEEHISFKRPNIMFRNLIMGQNSVDARGDITAINHNTKEKVALQLIPRESAEVNSKVTGQAFDSSGLQVGEISGSWRSEVYFKDLRVNKRERIYKLHPLIDCPHMQYYFFKKSPLMNFLSSEMASYICPTDSRFRGDIRNLEEGNFDQATHQKLEIEDQQRKVRKLIDEGQQPEWQPRFFKQIAHPFLDKVDGDDEGPRMFVLIEGDNGYWERRERKDWTGQPNLWGPFE